METNRINKWLDNSSRDNLNTEIIVLIIRGNSNNLNDLNIKSSFVNSIMLDYSSKYRRFKNSIFIIHENQVQNPEVIKKILLTDVILIDNLQSIQILIQKINNNQLDSLNNIQYTLLKKVDFEKLIKRETDEIGKFIMDRIEHLSKFNCDLGIKYSSWTPQYLELYETKKILLASFAQFLYRLATLNFIISEKSIGGIIRQSIGVRSKVVNYKSLGIILDIPNFAKNHRIYDLNENYIETSLKMKIAEKLIKLQKLDVSTIAQITELPIKKVETIYSTFNLR